MHSSVCVHLVTHIHKDMKHTFSQFTCLGHIVIPLEVLHELVHSLNKVSSPFVRLMLTSTSFQVCAARGRNIPADQYP